jgi:cytochrome c peroxidase
VLDGKEISKRKLFERVWGKGSLRCYTDEQVALVYDRIGISIAAYERSMDVNPFNSKFDNFWDNAKAAGVEVTLINVSNWMEYRHLGLTNEEVYGLAV